MKKSSIYIKNFYVFGLILFFGISQMNFASSSENDSLSFSKHGGVSFRYDDLTTLDNYARLTEIFNKYDAKFSLAINFGTFWSEEYIDSIRAIQQMGHEIMDHTPNHRTNYFKTQFPISEYLTEIDRDPIPGIDHIIGNKICLAFKEVDMNVSSVYGSGKIDKNIISGDFGELKTGEIYIYIEELSKLLFIKKRIGHDSIEVQDVWEDSVDFGVKKSITYFLFDRHDIHLTLDGVTLLANETTKLADKYNLDRPKIWIQPGGDFPLLTKKELKEGMGDRLSYIGGAAVYKGRQVYNEPDLLNHESFEMQWGDFFEDYWTLEECKRTIADRVAKHYLQIGHTHFYDLPDGKDRYFEKIDSLLSWLTTNNIPIKTYSEWVEILYELENDPYKNIFPSLDVDLDNNISELDINGVPDGYIRRYWHGEGQCEIDTVLADEMQYCYTISRKARICRVENLAGVEKGAIDFRIKTKGEPGDSIVVKFEFGEYSYETVAEFKFPADTKDWKEYSLFESTNGTNELVVPETETFISVDIVCSNYSSGEVKIKDMYLAKAQVTSVTEENEIIPNEFSLAQNYPNPFNPETKIRYSLTKTDDVKLKIYDILGREVATLVELKQNAGVYEVNFNGNQLASGIYFYTLSAGSALQTKKMILLK